MGGIDTNLTDEEALKNFLLDIDCLNELQPWTGHFNLFDVLKISRTEIRHSNVLSWLLNPNENHGMGDAFLKAVVQEMVVNDTKGRYDVFQTLLWIFIISLCTENGNILIFFLYRIRIGFSLRLKIKLERRNIVISSKDTGKIWKQPILIIKRC